MADWGEQPVEKGGKASLESVDSLQYTNIHEEFDLLSSFRPEKGLIGPACDSAVLGVAARPVRPSHASQ